MDVSLTGRYPIWESRNEQIIRWSGLLHPFIRDICLKRRTSMRTEKEDGPDSPKTRQCLFLHEGLDGPFGKKVTKSQRQTKEKSLEKGQQCWDIS